MVRTFPSDRPEKIRGFLEAYDGSHNLYFSVNPVRAAMKKKTKKEDIAPVAWYPVDCDPREGLDREEERARILKRLKSFTPHPTYIIDSGNGYQAFWRLEEPIPNEGDYDALETVNKWIEIRLVGDSCGNIDRVMRIPGTINLPGKVKLAKEYKPVVATLVHESEETVREDDFERLPERFVELLQMDKKVKARWSGDDTGLKDTSRSGFDLSLVALLKGEGLSREDTEKVLRLFPHGQYSDTKDERAFGRCWKKAGKGGRADLDCNQAIDELNKEFAVVLTGGKTSIIHESDAEDGGKDFDLLGPDAFRLWLQNRYCTVVGSKGKLTSLGYIEGLARQPLVGPPVTTRSDSGPGGMCRGPTTCGTGSPSRRRKGTAGSSAGTCMRTCVSVIASVTSTCWLGSPISSRTQDIRPARPSCWWANKGRENP